MCIFEIISQTMPTFSIQHVTKYTYSNMITDAANKMLLYPINDDFQKVTYQKININTNPFIETYFDYFNNKVRCISNF